MKIFGQITNGLDPRSLFSRSGLPGFTELDGSFACVFTEGTKTVLVRDPFGTIPLYYHVDAQGTVKSSDRVLDLLAQGVPRKLSRQGLLAYLSYGHACSPLTLVDNVFSVPQGHAVVVDYGQVTVARYWQPDFTTRLVSPDVAQEQVTEAVRTAIRKSCGGDTLPAAFLSGGIDSSAIVAVMRTLHPTDEIRTYCVKHDDDRTEESAWARKVAEQNHTRHTELHLSDALVKNGILAAVDSYDQPTLDGVNFYFASKLVRDAGESVILSGEGGDELFAGYNRFAKHMLAYQWSKRFRLMGSALWGRPVGSLLEACAPSEKVRKLGSLLKIPYDPYSLPRRIFTDGQIKWLLNPDLWETMQDYQSAYTQDPTIPQGDLINRISWLELQTVTADAWLRDGYQTAAAHGLTIHTPLLDKALAELLFTIPGSQKVCDAYLKPLLVHAAGEGLPMACVTRPKMGFSLPFDRYFRSSLKGELESFLLGNESTLFSSRALCRLNSLFLTGKVNWSRIWALFVLDRWCRKNGLSV